MSHGEPLRVQAYVKCVTDGRFKLEKFAPGMSMSLGPTVGLVIEEIDVIVTSGRSQTLDHVIFRMHGIDVTKYKVVALKSSSHFRAGFRELPNGFRPEIMVCDPPGLTSNELSFFARTKAAQELWPYVRSVAYANAELPASVANAGAAAGGAGRSRL